MDYNRTALQNELIRDEGLRLTPYRDSLGFLTIGVGHLINRGESFAKISREEALELLDKDIATAERRLDVIFPLWRAHDEVRQRAMLNLTFNLGYKLADFKRFLHSFQVGDWEKAADHLTQSRWFKQVKTRGPKIVHAIRTGTVPWSAE